MKGQASRESGQAVVEYLLLAVITLGLILGMKKVFGKLNTGAQKYMGDYIVCLMDYGELPTMGLPSSAGLSKHDSGSMCDRKFENFTFGEGRPPVSSPGTTQQGGGGGSNPNSNQSSRTSTNGSDNDANSNNKSNSQNGGSGASDLAKAGEGGSSGSSSKSPYKSGQVQRKGDVYGTLDGAGSGGDSKSRVIDDDGDDAAGAGGRNRRQGRRGRNNTIYYGENYRAITGGKAFDALNKQLKKSQARKPTATIRSIATEEGRSLSSNRKEITPQERLKEPPPSSDDGKFTFGNFMRWLLIAGMVIAIVIFFGGQVMNYSNSSD